jgi:hypothetical protein
MHLIHGETSNGSTIYLENLISEPYASQSSWRTLHDQAHKHTLVDGLHPYTNLSSSIFAQSQL